MAGNILKRVFSCAFSIVLFTAAWTGTGLAQSGTTNPTVVPPVPAGALGEQEQADVNRFAVNHPEIAEELHKNPSLINNPQWLAQHPEINQWMKTHPAFQKDAAANPRWLVNKEESSALNDVRNGTKTTDTFMASHPGMAKQLAADPGLIDNKQYLAQHPELGNFLKTHPEIQQEWQNHPVAFAKAAEKSASKQPAAHPVARPK
ncbi:MAG: hypothetical protein ACLP6G_00615 [Terriglobales bacterium]